MKPSATTSFARESPTRASIGNPRRLFSAPRSPQTPSLPCADPRSGRPRRGGRKSKFLAVNDDEFGNYIAGYDAYTAFGAPFGTAAVRSAGYWYSLTDYLNGIHPSFDLKESNINQGIFDSYQYFDDPDADAFNAFLRE